MKRIKIIGRNSTEQKEKKIGEVVHEILSLSIDTSSVSRIFSLAPTRGRVCVCV